MAHGLGPEAPYVGVRIMNERHAEPLRDDARIELAAPRGILRKGHADVALAGALRFQRPPGADLERLRIDLERREDHRDSPHAMYRRSRCRRSRRAEKLASDFRFSRGAECSGLSSSISRMPARAPSSLKRSTIAPQPQPRRRHGARWYHTANPLQKKLLRLRDNSTVSSRKILRSAI